ncbi:WS/DGAT/MGAT acyltransferase [Sulfuritalea hydrogenivorans sk43H]|uniref:diacylglycerol O-acyltransferase n=2 Tax=Sulfuritalea hydrogenivorans TaxID=748811 RepID=W0SIM3_9PROT|nr:WS/DGAT/MGAT acyltransferase [Sulfuritalea hydrogenivorans sk43H]
MPQRERMSPVDTAWLRMDRPTNLMMIVGVLVFKQRMDFERLRNTIEARLAGRYRRFRQCAVEEVAGAWWQDDPDFDIDAHLKRRALPSGAGKKELQKLAGELAVQPLNPGKPLWRFDLIEDYEGGSAMVVRIHHSIADGIALVGVILSLTDLSPQAPAQKHVTPEPEDTDADDVPVGLLETLADTLTSALDAGSDLGSKAYDLASDRDRLATYGRHGIGLLTELAKLLAMPPDSATSLKGKTSTTKRVAWSDPIPLGEVKALGKALGCSVNDILLSAVAGALRAYFQQKGETVHEVEVRAMIPVNLRTARDEGTLGNRFGLGTLSLPLHEGNPFARLFLVRSRMNELKNSYQPPLTLGILAAVGIAPKIIQQQFLDILAAKASTVMTNVPGPKQPLYLAGSRLDQCMFWVPQSGDIGIGVSILSYNDNVQFSLITDRHFVPDPETITPLFAAEFDKMMLALLMLEWDKPVDPALAEQLLFGTQMPSPLAAGKTRNRKPAATAARNTAKPRKPPSKA